MSDVAIHVEGLGKRYRLGRKERYRSLRESWSNAFKRGNSRTDRDTIWALKDVSFEVKKGEVVGVIGRNGAGKSTLLKILSRITRPTTGKVDIHGRVGSLLEVGTGFHPELTGRENVFLNGAVLGMARREVQASFDEIVDFAGVEEFLDTPVKRYSSGMAVRLAFAVAAHLDPEILLVDEVLAVGDAAFQKKCLGKMGEVAQGGRTVLFVSHNMAAVSALTSGAVLFDGGLLLRHDDTDDVIRWYLRELRDKAPSTPVCQRADRDGDGRARIVELTIDDTKGHVNTIPLSRESKRIHIGIEARERVSGVSVVVSMLDIDRRRVMWMDSSLNHELYTFEQGRHDIRIDLVKGVSPAPGEYFLNIALISSDGHLDYVADALKISIEIGDFYGSGKFPKRNPVVFVEQNWVIC